jgi:hypothetical protein
MPNGTPAMYSRAGTRTRPLKRSFVFLNCIFTITSFVRTSARKEASARSRPPREAHGFKPFAQQRASALSHHAS